MSVRPTNFNADGSIDVVFDEQGHTGTIPAAEVKWSQGIDGADNHNYIVLACPDGCGATSTWPVGGGADAVMGQQMFVEKVAREGCVCPEMTVGKAAVTPQAAVDHVKELVTAMDGEERWQLDDAVLARLGT